MNVFGLKTNNLKKHKCLVKRGAATKRFFFNLWFAKYEKLSSLGGGVFFQFLVDVQITL